MSALSLPIRTVPRIATASPRLLELENIYWLLGLLSCSKPPVVILINDQVPLATRLVAGAQKRNLLGSRPRSHRCHRAHCELHPNIINKFPMIIVFSCQLWLCLHTINPQANGRGVVNMRGRNEGERRFDPLAVPQMVRQWASPCQE